MIRRISRGEAHGQILIVFVLALVAILAMTSLVIEGGNVVAQQRIAQNAADATANAGTIVIAEKLAGSPRTGLDVYNAVTASVAANGLENGVAVYTDNFGEPFDPAIVVAAGTPLPDNARGVRVAGDRVVGTSFARVIGINELSASAEATAIAGAASDSCPTDSPCGLLPVTFPISTSICDESGRFTGIGVGELWELAEPPLTDDNESIVPLCSISEAAIGWLDLGPGNLADEIEGGVQDFDFPAWVQTQPGTPNSVEDEINDNYADSLILIPMFDGTCKIDPGDGSLPCPDEEKGVDPVGNNTYYHIPYLSAFWLDEAITQGANVDDCNAHDGEPKLIATTPEFLGCLTGWFVDYVYPGEVDPTTTITESTVIAIQLIR